MNATRKFILRNRGMVSGLVIMLLLTIVLGYFVFTMEEEDTDLIVDEVIFNSIEMEGEESDLKITVMLTNKGETDIDDVKMRAFVIERDSNLAMDEAGINIGTIPGLKTEEGEMSISVPNNDSYRIELLVFEDSKLTKRGSGTIDLTGVGVASDYAEQDDDDTGNDVPSEGLRWSSEEGDTAASSILIVLFCFIIIPIIIVLIAVIVSSATSKKNARKKDEDNFFKTGKGRGESERSRAKPLEQISTFDDQEEENPEPMEEEDYDT